MSQQHAVSENKIRSLGFKFCLCQELATSSKQIARMMTQLPGPALLGRMALLLFPSTSGILFPHSFWKGLVTNGMEQK